MERSHHSRERQRPAAADEAASTIQGGMASIADIKHRLSPYFARAEPRQQALTYLLGLLSPIERKNSWQLAEVSGETTPYGFQHLLRRADWRADAVCGELRTDIVPHLGESRAVLVIDETGFLKKGQHSAGVARPYRGTAGRIEHCQIGVFLAYASQHGHAVLDRARYLPKAWLADPARCQRAGIPDQRCFATKPQLAQQMLPRVLEAGMPVQWVTGDSVDGDDRRLRMWLEARPQAYVLAVSGKEYGWLGWQQRQVKTVLAVLPEEGWTRLSAGDGAKGPRWDDWRWLPLADPMEAEGRRWLLVRRSISEPTELRAYVVFAPQGTALAEVAGVAGTRWTIERCVEAAKGEVGLDHDEVRSWGGWYRPSVFPQEWLCKGYSCDRLTV